MPLHAERTIPAERDARDVWDFVRDMSNWASQMPGYLSHEEFDDRHSVWTLQVNMGPFAKPVVIDVAVSEWIEPREVAFRMKGRFEPFHGGGRCVVESDTEVVVKLFLDVEVSGSMSMVLTAMADPVLQVVADQFAANLAQALAAAEDDAVPAPLAAGGQPAGRGWAARLRVWLRRAFAPRGEPQGGRKESRTKFTGSVSSIGKTDSADS